MPESPAPLVLLPQPRRLARLPGTSSIAETRIVIDPSNAPANGYRLSISPAEIRIVAHTPAAAFYGRQTLAQIRRQFPGTLPCLEIKDSPDFPVRGVMLDISRDKVPTMKTLFNLVVLLSHWKINQLQLYTEHTFAYSQHQEVWKDASPMTAEEIRTLDWFCQEHFIELVPNQNSFGHMERWLKHPRYQPLAETTDGAQTPWGYRWKGPFSLCPTDPRSIEFLAGLYDELLPNFTSRLFNVGCDETFDIGQGRSRGVENAYLQFLKQVHQLVARHDRTMMFWGDIIVQKPELIAHLPRPIIALEWGYEADHPFETEGAMFAQSGVPFYVCPGTSSWLSISGRTDNMLANQRNAASAGLKHGAIGYLNTDWGDHGHLQYLPISYAGFAAGAAMSWCVEANRDLNLPAVLNLHAFGDSAEKMGQLACGLGNVYQSVGKLWTNSSALFRILVPSSTHRDVMEGITEDGLLAAEAAIDRAMSPLADAKVDPLITAEFANAAAMLRLACAKGRKKEFDADPIIAEHRRLWLARNRPGGLEDSVRRLLQ
jgi:hexosaminidase